MEIWADLSSVLSTRLTDGPTAFSWLDRIVCNACSAVKRKQRLYTYV